MVPFHSRALIYYFPQPFPFSSSLRYSCYNIYFILHDHVKYKTDCICDCQTFFFFFHSTWCVLMLLNILTFFGQIFIFLSCEKDFLAWKGLNFFSRTHCFLLCFLCHYKFHVGSPPLGCALYSGHWEESRLYRKPWCHWTYVFAWSSKQEKKPGDLAVLSPVHWRSQISFKLIYFSIFQCTGRQSLWADDAECW